MGLAIGLVAWTRSTLLRRLHTTGKIEEPCVSDEGQEGTVNVRKSIFIAKLQKWNLTPQLPTAVSFSSDIDICHLPAKQLVQKPNTGRLARNRQFVHRALTPTPAHVRRQFF